LFRLIIIFYDQFILYCFPLDYIGLEVTISAHNRTRVTVSSLLDKCAYASKLSR